MQGGLSPLPERETPPCAAACSDLDEGGGAGVGGGAGGLKEAQQRLELLQRHRLRPSVPRPHHPLQHLPATVDEEGSCTGRA